MKLPALIFAAWLLGLAALDAALPAKVTIWSSSKQIAVTGLPPIPQNPEAIDTGTVTNTIRLDASELALTCENIKRVLLREMDIADHWQRTIRVIQHAELNASAQITIAAVRYEDGWTYNVHVPEEVDREKLVRAVVQALFQEIADRYSPERTIEVPLWLKEGMTMQVITAGGPDLIALARPVKRAINNQMWLLGNSTRTELRTNSLSEAHTWLKSHPTVSFSDLSMPLGNQLSGENWTNYQASAQVFVMQLMKFNDGHTCMRQFIQTLPKYLNPQLAFLDAFKAHFKSPLEVEKWWSVTTATFLAQDVHSKWPGAAALERLDEVLLPEVEVRVSTNALPASQRMTLQQLIQDVDYGRQKNALRDVVARLNALEWTVTSDQLKLLYDYHRTLLNYLQQRDKITGTNNTRDPASSPKLLVRETIKQLDLLDLLRSDLKKYGLDPAPTVGAK